MFDVKNKTAARDIMIWGAGIFFIGLLFWGILFEAIGFIVFLVGLTTYLSLSGEERKKVPA
jgi:hypothetical protein